MVRPIVALLVILGAPISIAQAQTGQDIDPATLAVLHDPPRLQLRISVVEADLRASEQRLAALPDRTPWHVGLGLGIALVGAGAVTEFVALLGVVGSEIGGGLSCGLSTLRSEPCRDPGTPPWIVIAAAAGAAGIVTGLVTLLIGVSQLDSIARQETRLERRRNGRLRELDLLRAFDVQATGHSIGIWVSGTL